MKNNRTAGHTFERYIRQWFIRMGWKDCQTSRYASREMDDKCVDLVNTEPFYAQMKYTQSINIHTELDKMPKDHHINIVFHKRKNKGVVVAMSLEDFGEIVHSLKENGVW